MQPTDQLSKEERIRREVRTQFSQSEGLLQMNWHLAIVTEPIMASDT